MLLLQMMIPAMMAYDMNIGDHIAAIVICVFAPILAFTSRRTAPEEIHLEPEEKIGLYHSNALLLFVFAIVVITMWRVPGRTLAELGFIWPQWNTPVLLLILIVALFYGLDIFFQYGTPKRREKTFQQRHQTLVFIPADKNEFFHFLALALAAGVGEEIIFRGYLIHYIISWTGNTPQGILAACLFSSALFAFLHGYQGVKSMLKIFFLALLFSAIFVLSQSLMIVILIHTLIDGLSGWLGIRLHQYLKEQDNPDI